MKQRASWRPTKFQYSGGKLSVGPEASASSWIITRLVADAYGRHLPVQARGRLVDLGCGTVPLYEAYRDLVSGIICVDLRADDDRGRHLDLAHDLNQPLPLADASFDTAILSDVLEHVRKPEALLAEVARILAPQGKLLLNVPFFYWLHEQPADYFRYTEHALRSFVEQVGLRLVVLEVLGSAPEVVADIVGKHLAQLPAVGPTAARALQRLTFGAARAPGLERALAASRQRFPMAYFVVAQKPG